MHLHLVFKWATENGTSKWQQPSSQQHFWPDREGRTVHGELQGEKKKREKEKKLCSKWFNILSQGFFPCACSVIALLLPTPFYFSYYIKAMIMASKKKSHTKTPHHTQESICIVIGLVSRESTRRASAPQLVWNERNLLVQLHWPGHTNTIIITRNKQQF